MPAPTYSYDYGLSQVKDQVRHLIRDTGADGDWILSDEEIIFAANLQGGSIYLKAAACAEAAATELGRHISFGGQTKLDAREQQQMMMERAKSLRARAATAGVVPIAGGISQADKEASRTDPDRTQPAFTVDLHETGDLSVSTDTASTSF